MTKRFSSPKELEEFRKDILLKRDPNKLCISLCSGTGCLAYGSQEVAAAFIEELTKKGLE